jgi:hypothetical protein
MLSQALLMLGKGGEVHVALRRTPFYDSWGVAALAEEAGLALAAEEAFAGARFKALGMWRSVCVWGGVLGILQSPRPLGFPRAGDGSTVAMTAQC